MATCEVAKADVTMVTIVYTTSKISKMADVVVVAESSAVNQ
jgi:hypothetical protein